MKLGLMQPYFFPYLGYFQLINYVDAFVIYDDVKFAKNQWVKRNYILGSNNPQRITLQLSQASPNKLINQISVGGNGSKILKTIEHTYNKAPYRNEVMAILRESLLQPEKELAVYLENILRQICAYLGMSTEIVTSSSIEKDNSLKAGDKIISICRKMNVDSYVNPIGGKELYSYSLFRDAAIELSFIKMKEVTYKQFTQEFIPNLSIIDILMFCDVKTIKLMLNEFDIGH
jgi:WbqC-like protein family